MTTTEQTAVNRSTTNDHAPATMQTPKSKRIVGASQRRAEILVATIFSGERSHQFPRDFRPESDSERLRLSGQGFSQQGSSRIEFPAVVDQQHWDCLHRGVCVSLAQKTQ